MKFLLLTPEGTLFEGEVRMVIVKGTEGELGILPGHAPLISRLLPGPVRVKLPQGGEREFQLPGGLLQVSPERVLILAEPSL